MPAMPEDDATESVANRVKDFPEEISKPILSLLEKDEGMAKEVADAWESVKDASEYIQARFKEMLEEGDFKAAISHATDFDEDDEIKGLLNSNFKPKGPTLLEALKTRLKLQREGRATQWKPLPDKVEVTHLVERLRQQSKERFNASGAC